MAASQPGKQTQHTTQHAPWFPGSWRPLALVVEHTLFSRGSGVWKGTYSSPTHETMPRPVGRFPGGGSSVSSLSLSMAWKHLLICCITCRGIGNKRSCQDDPTVPTRHKNASKLPSQCYTSACVATCASIHTEACKAMACCKWLQRSALSSQ